VIYTQMQRESN
jgi:hypothetical protein